MCPAKLERYWGGMAGIGLGGKSFRTRDEAEEVCQWLIARAYMGEEP